MLDVGRRILRMHEAGDRVFQLPAIDDDRRVHRKEVVLAGVVDMQMGVADEADVAHAHAVLRSWFSIMFSWYCSPRMPSVSMIWLER